MVFSSWPLAFCFRRYPLSGAEHRVLVLEGPGVKHGQTDLRAVQDALNHLNVILSLTATLVLTAGFHDNLGKMVPECQTVVDFAATTDDGSGGSYNRNCLRRAKSSSIPTPQVFKG